MLGRRIAKMTGAAAIILTATAVWAQSNEDVVLHEYFNPWDVDVSTASSAASGSPSTAKPPSGQPARAPGEPPGLSVNPGEDEVIFGADGPVDPGITSTPYGPLDPRQQSSKLDDRTDRVDQLDYYANFEPSVVPYKRVVVQNKVQYNAGDYLLALDEGRYRRVAVEGGGPRAGEETFWGSFLVRAKKGERHPLPSVAPSQRILEVQAEPDTSVRFERDRAHNFYVVPQKAGLLRLNIKLAVPKAYFNGSFGDIDWSDLSRSQSEANRTPALPSSVNTVAANVLDSLGISRQMRPKDALTGLVEYYRNFEGRKFPDKLRGKDLYASLSREQVGVCRHRSLAFLISARALGISTRYIYNEAHAFVEVYWPKTGWRRIDLGGAANELNYSSQAGGTVHDAGQDNLPQPPNYQNELDRMRERGGEVGEAEQEGAESNSSDASGADSAGEASTPGDGPTTPGGEMAEMADAAKQHAMEGAAPHLEEAESDASQASERHEEQDRRAKVIIDVEADTSEVFRGNALGLTGSLFTQQGQPLAKREVRVMLAPPGSKSEQATIELGTLRTDTGGRFQGQLSIPDSVTIGRWSVILTYAGDDEHQPARAE
ncbi:transglutaminase domain-containing protein [Persicimonas caeni]|nr:transglutaminase domain-containing protein [Persicimonas caeni]